LRAFLRLWLPEALMLRPVPCCLRSLVPEKEAGDYQADRVGRAPDNHEVCDVHHDAVSHIVVLEKVVDKFRHVKFSLE
jgi:hypothetical protein